MPKAIATLLLTTCFFACGTQPPEASGVQRIVATDAETRVSLILTGPKGIRGAITTSDPAYFAVQVQVDGPADGVAFLNVDNPHPNGCNLSSHLPAYLLLDEIGGAEVEAWVTFWAEEACAFSIQVHAASDYTGQYKDPDTDEFRSYLLKGKIDSTRAQISFRNLGAS